MQKEDKRKAAAPSKKMVGTPMMPEACRRELTVRLSVATVAGYEALRIGLINLSSKSSIG